MYIIRYLELHQASTMKDLLAKDRLKFRYVDYDWTVCVNIDRASFNHGHASASGTTGPLLHRCVLCLYHCNGSFADFQPNTLSPSLAFRHINAVVMHIISLISLIHSLQLYPRRRLHQVVSYRLLLHHPAHSALMVLHSAPRGNLPVCFVWPLRLSQECVWLLPQRLLLHSRVQARHQSRYSIKQWRFVSVEIYTGM